jgi:hypothetical protein
MNEARGRGGNAIVAVPVTDAAKHTAQQLGYGAGGQADRLRFTANWQTQESGDDPQRAVP